MTSAQSVEHCRRVSWDTTRTPLASVVISVMGASSASAGRSGGKSGSACFSEGSGAAAADVVSVEENTGSPRSASVSTSGGSGPKEGEVEKQRDEDFIDFIIDFIDFIDFIDVGEDEEEAYVARLRRAGEDEEEEEEEGRGGVVVAVVVRGLGRREAAREQGRRSARRALRVNNILSDFTHPNSRMGFLVASKSHAARLFAAH